MSTAAHTQYEKEIKFTDNEAAAYSRCTFLHTEKQIINNIIKWKQNGIIIAHLLAIKPHKIPTLQC